MVVCLKTHCCLGGNLPIVRVCEEVEGLVGVSANCCQCNVSRFSLSRETDPLLLSLVDKIPALAATTNKIKKKSFRQGDGGGRFIFLKYHRRYTTHIP